MNIISAGYNILSPDLDDPNAASKIYKQIERVGRVCYKSENNITDESAEKFVRNLIKSGHEAMLEHTSMSVLFIVDRGVSHEIVRHRIASFAQESTRYCNYAKDKFGNHITVIRPFFFHKEGREKDINAWNVAMLEAEEQYLKLIANGASPQEARSVLPNSLKTEIVMTANMREWRHFFKLRAAGVTGKPHPQMLEVTVPLLNECRRRLPALFDDIEPMGF